MVSEKTQPQPAQKQELPQNAKTSRVSFRLLGTALLVAVSYFAYNKIPLLLQSLKPGLVLDDVQLRGYDGRDPSKPIYVALDGTIYDVTPGARFYGPGGTYNVLAGKDAARSYVTGCFEDDNPDLRGAEYAFVPKDIPGPDATGDEKVYRDEQLKQAKLEVDKVLDGWRKVFSGQTGKPYFEVGKTRSIDWEKVPRKVLCDAAEKKRPATGRK